jgi:formylmethanofuran dehydrogenase subunit E
MKCKRCGDPIDEVLANQTVDGLVCDDCFEHYHYCDACDVLLYEENLYFGENGTFCRSCWPHYKTRLDDIYDMLARTDPRF